MQGEARALCALIGPKPGSLATYVPNLVKDVRPLANKLAFQQSEGKPAELADAKGKPLVCQFIPWAGIFLCCGPTQKLDAMSNPGGPCPRGWT